MITFNQDKEKSFTINGWENGISESATSGFFNMINVNNHASPGLMKSIFRLNRTTKLYNYGSSSALTFTASDSGGKLLLTATNQFESDGLSVNKQAFTVTNAGGALPGGLVAGTIYYAIKISNSEIKVATSLANAEAGTAMNYVDAGSGTNTVVPMKPKGIIQFADDGVAGGSTICGIDTDGRVWTTGTSGLNWYLLDGNTAGASSNSGVAYWKGYWFFFKATKCDLITAANVNNLTATWADLDWTPTGWAALQDYSHYTFIGQDNIIYFCNGIYIGSIKEKAATTFDPANNATYTVNPAALDLPYVTTTIDELRTDLVIGTVFNKVYFWDRLSASFSFPLTLPEKYTFDIVNVDNILYLFSGYSGTVYKSNGVSVDVAVRIPEHLSNYYYSQSIKKVVFTQADRLAKRIIFPVQVYDTVGNVINAVWSYYPKNNSLVIENTQTDIVTQSNFSFGAIKGINEKNYIVNYYTTGFGAFPAQYIITAVDYTNSGSFTTCSNYVSTTFQDVPSSVTTEIFSLGTHLNTATINQIELSLADVFSSGQGVNIYYRPTISSAWTLLKLIDYATYGAINNIVVEAPLSGIKDIQFKIEILNGSNVPYTININTVSIKHVRFILG